MDGSVKEYLRQAIRTRGRVVMTLVNDPASVERACHMETDLLGVFHTACLHVPLMAGYLPIGDANGTVLEAAGTVLSAAERLPVFAGVCCFDPIRLMGPFLQNLKAQGFSGLVNFPPVGYIDGELRTNMEGRNFGFAREVNTVELAVRNQWLLPLPMVFTPEEGERMVRAGADMLVFHPGFLENDEPAARAALRACRLFTAAVRRLASDAVVLLYVPNYCALQTFEILAEPAPPADGFFLINENAVF